MVVTEAAGTSAAIPDSVRDLLYNFRKITQPVSKTAIIMPTSKGCYEV